jgi:hypothetical protein
MRHDRLKKAVEKYAEVKNKPGRADQFFAEFNGETIEWSLRSFDKENVNSPYVRRTLMKDDIVSDYFAGDFYYTIKSAIKSFTAGLNRDII